MIKSSHLPRAAQVDRSQDVTGRACHGRGRGIENQKLRGRALSFRREGEYAVLSTKYESFPIANRRFPDD
jgi:hypothetical protein